MYKGIPYWNIALCGPDPQCDYMGELRPIFAMLSSSMVSYWSGLHYTLQGSFLELGLV